MVMDTKTGAIRAWAQYPSYNANDYGAVQDLRTSATWRCRNRTSPGLTMKVITFAGGLNNKAFTPNTVIDEKQTAHRWLPDPRLGRASCTVASPCNGSSTTC